MVALRAVVARVKTILKTEGLLPLLRVALLFLTRYLFCYETYHLFEFQHDPAINPDDFKPSIPNLSHYFVTTNQQADELTTQFDDFRSYCINARERLDSGAVALCVFSGRKLAHMEWIATSEAAKRTFNDMPYRVDFANKEACYSDVTIPEYRGKGIRTYGNNLVIRYLTERGIMTGRAVIRISNQLSLSTLSLSLNYSEGSRVYAGARYIKFLCWKFWKETPMNIPAKDMITRHRN